MNALTLRQPWAHAVAHWGKRVENRGWAPYPLTIGRPLAIHAGTRFDFHALAELRGRGHDPERRAVPARSAVVAVAQLAGVERDDATGRLRFGPWWEGPIGWVLDGVVALPTPVPCRGRQGLWMLPPDTERLVLAQLALATSAAGGGA